jgi:dTDP-4-dehydrorhamnose reductase
LKAVAPRKKLQPDVVIDTAALHNVDYWKIHPEEAWRVNVEGTKNVAEACGEIDAKMIFVSIDYIFDGKKGFYTFSTLLSMVKLSLCRGASASKRLLPVGNRME